ncbi:Cna B-type domain-containing protein [Erysipelothrix rhusiopathiae]|uniref:Cna B-type domain-containing protein n=1 Tax=Erysipelothrix rhusiopathiae TaxID=1648 RepID=UPI002B253F38|nr:Cna B-type domain-containing protein [Erysipelothrix rhusiopathiae]WRB93244.1 Cna B-type domain-containing protein [Erysipelothrix rhusiopathiae]
MKTRIIKSGLTVLLITMVLLSINTSFVSAEGNPSSSEKTITNSIQIDNMNEGEVRVFKTAKPIPNSINRWEISIDVFGRVKREPSDIVLVLDTSGSMDPQKNPQGIDRISKAKREAIHFVNEIFERDASARVALVSYGTKVSTNAFHTKQESNLLINEIKSLKAEGGTFTQGALYEAKTLLNQSSAPNKTIVLLSDGQPTYRYPLKAKVNQDLLRYDGNVIVQKRYNGQQRPFDIGITSSSNQAIPGYRFKSRPNTNVFDYNAMVYGTGNEYYLDELGELRTQGNQNYFVYMSSGDAAIIESNQIHQEQIHLYAIGFDTDVKGTDILKRISNNNYYDASSSRDNLDDIFKKISNNIYSAAKDIHIEDPMSNAFNVDESSLTEELKSMFDVTHQRFNIRSQGLLDEEGDIQHYGYKYEVSTKPTSSISEKDFYELNKTTMITYNDVNNQSVKKTIKVPQPKPTPVRLKTEVYKADKSRDLNTKYQMDVLFKSKDMEHKLRNESALNKVSTSWSFTDHGTYDVMIDALKVEGATHNLDDYDVVYEYYEHENGVRKPVSGLNIHKDPESYEVVVKLYQKPLGTITIDKLVKQGSKTVYPDDTFIFEVYNEDYKIDEILLKSGESRTLNHLPIGKYQIREKEREGYTSRNPHQTFEVTYSSREHVLHFVNDVENKTSYLVEKVWVGGTMRQSDVRIDLKQNGIPLNTPKVLEKGHLKLEFTDLPRFDKEGNEYEYSPYEMDIPDHFESSVVGNKITNTYVIPQRSYTVTKVWDGGPLIKPTIMVQLYQNNQPYKYIELESGQTSYTWNELPETDEQGNAFNYHVEEMNVPENYEMHVEASTITNTYISPTRDISVTKEWIGGPATKPTIEIALLADGHEVARHVMESGTTQITFKNQPIYDRNGLPISYKAIETQGAQDYINIPSDNPLVIKNEYRQPRITDPIIATKEWIGGPSEKPDVEMILYRQSTSTPERVDSKVLSSGQTKVLFSDLEKTDKHGNLYTYWIEEGNQELMFNEHHYAVERKDAFTIVNRYQSPKTTFTMNKVWNGGPEIKPDIEVQLLKNGENVGSPVILHHGETSYTWSDLDEFDINGNKNDYRVREVREPKGYVQEIDPSGSTITNHFEPEMRTINAYLYWEHGPDQKPTVTFNLYQIIDGIETPVGDPKNLETGVSSVSWDVPAQTQEGQNIEYFVKQTDLTDDYTMRYGSDRLIVINTYQPPVHEIVLDKQWVGGAMTQAVAEFTLYQNGNIYDVVKLGHNDSIYTWLVNSKDLKGNEINYKLEETSVPDHFVSETIDAWTFRNTYTSPKKDVTVTKHWINAPDTVPTVHLQLLRNNEPIGDPISLENGQTSYTWKNLDETDDRGNAYEYRVHEIDPPEGYVVQYSEDGLEIFNKYQGDVSSIQKDKPNPQTPLEKNTEPKEENRDKPMSNGVLPQTGVGNRVLIISGGFMIGMGILILLKKKD